MFREKDIHFIAIGNNIDSDHDETSGYGPFLNIMNEWYVRDTSKKLRSALRARGSTGNAHTSNNCIYGYQKDPDDSDHWIIDPEAAAVVRRIFQMCIDGKGPYQIARILANEKIERLSYYPSVRGRGNNQVSYDRKHPYSWAGVTVVVILARKEYTGCIINFKTYTRSYKGKNLKSTPEEDRVYFENTQEAIIDLETWELVQRLRKNVRRTSTSRGEANPLTGKVFCAECGAPMYHHRGNKNYERVYFVKSGERRTFKCKPTDGCECSTFIRSRQIYDGKCTCHSVMVSTLNTLVYRTIKDTCSYVNFNEEEFVALVSDISKEEETSTDNTIRDRIKKNEVR